MPAPPPSNANRTEFRTPLISSCNRQARTAIPGIAQLAVHACVYTPLGHAADGPGSMYRSHFGAQIERAGVQSSARFAQPDEIDSTRRVVRRSYGSLRVATRASSRPDTRGSCTGSFER